MQSPTDPRIGALELQTLTPTDEAGIRSVAALHMQLLDYGPMAGLGERFIREVGYRMLMEDGLLRVVLAKFEGKPIGFVAYTERSISFHRSSLRKHVVRVAWTLFRSLLEEPRRIAALGRALRVLGSRRSELERGKDPLGELVAIAVQRDVLSSAFVRRTGLRISDELVNLVRRRLARAGITEMRMLVDHDNKAALFMYHGMGARMQPYVQAGEPMVEVWFDLDPNAAELGLPDCWSQRGSVAGDVGSWPEYWERLEDEQPVFKAEARDYVDRLRTDLKVGGRVLDFGCGFAWAADTLAPHVAEMAVWDSAANMRKRARLRLAAHPNTTFVDLADGSGEARAGKFDAILVNSVTQYMSEPQLLEWLRRWRGLLAPNGRLVLSDIILPAYSFRADLLAFLWFSFKNGFLFRSVIGGIREIGSYQSVKGALPLLKLGVADLERLAAQSGLQVTRHPRNLTFHANRLSVVLTAAGERS